MRSHKLSILERILEVLDTPVSRRHKGVSVNIFGLPIFSDCKKQSISNSLYNLKKKGYIISDGETWRLSKTGREYRQKILSQIKYFDSPFDKNAPKNLIVMFDIPEDRKTERNWFRFHLRKFGYIMIQKSVWVGPSPLPKEFISYIESIKLKDSVKAFRLAKDYRQFTSIL